MVVTVALSGISAIMFVFVPPARTTPNYSSVVEFDLTCGEENFILTPKLDKNDCDFFDKPVTMKSIVAKDCGYICQKPVFDYPVSLKKKLKKTAMKIDHNSTLSYVCEFKSKSIAGHEKCFTFNKNKSYSNQNMPESFSIHGAQLDVHVFKQNISEIEITDPKMTTTDGKVHCSGGTVPKFITVPIITFNENKTTLKRFKETHKTVKCTYHCYVSVPHNNTCKDQPNTIEHDVYFTLAYFIGGIVIMRCLVGFSSTLFEISAVAVLKVSIYIF